MENTDFKQVLEYIKKVVGEGWKDTIAFYRADWKNSLGNIFTGIVAAFAFPNLPNRFWGIVMPDALPQTLSAIGSGVIGFLAFAVFLLFLNIAIFTPARLWNYQKGKAELYTHSGIEIVAFNPDETDSKPAGLMVTNKKGITIRSAANLRKILKNRRELLEINERPGLTFYDELMKYGYADLENNRPKLLVLEHVRREFRPTPGITTFDVSSKEEIEKDKNKVVVETNQQNPLHVYENERCVIQIDFWFIINNLYLKGFIVECTLENISGKLIVTKTREWLDENEE